MGNLNDLRQWKCQKGHVLGVVERIRVGDRHVSRLLLYRHAIDLTQPRPDEVDVIGPVNWGGPYRCDVPGCGEARVWGIGQDAYENLMEVLDGHR